MAILANSLAVGVNILSTLGERDDVVPDGGYAYASLCMTEHTERLLVEEASTELLEARPTDTGSGLSVCPVLPGVGRARPLPMREDHRTSQMRAVMEHYRLYS